jgi:heme exporter protein D
VSYLNYVIASYAIFVLVLGWEFLASRLQIGRELRNARRRAARQSSRSGTTGTRPPGSPTANAPEGTTGSTTEAQPPISNELTR